MESAKPGKEHKEKKHKEKKHKEKKHQPDSEKKRERKDKKQQQQQQQQPPAAPAAAAAAAAVAVPSGSSVPSPALPFDGLGLQQLQFSCPLDFAAAKAGQDEEVWVLRLPAGLPVSLLHGCSIHMPAEPPAAHSTGATPPAAKQPAADALQHGKAHAPAQVIGHVALDGSDAATHDVYCYREVLQEDEFLVQRLRVAGPAVGQPCQPSQQLHCLKVARLLSISDDVRIVSKKQLPAAVAAGAELGPLAAWDGKLPPSKLRTRIGGWRVVGQEQQQQQRKRRKAGSSSDSDDEDAGSSSDEEFTEVVFGNSSADGAAAAAGSSGDSDRFVQQQQGGGVDAEQRYYGSSSDDEAGSAAGLKDDWDVLNERFNLGKFLLKLPVQAAVVAAQRTVYPSMMQQQQADDSSSSDDDASSDSDSDGEQAPATAAGSSKKAAAGAMAADADDSSSEDEEGKPFLDDEDNGPAAMDVDGDSSEGWDEDDDDKSAKKQQQQQQQQQQKQQQPSAVHAPVINSGSWSAPPKPLRDLVGSCLGWAEQQQLAALSSNKQLQRRMTNVAQLVRIDWADVCAQLDMDAMSDYQTEMLLKLLQLREQFSSAYDSEGEALQLQLLLPSGASRRPRFTDTDAGYAYYQAADAAPVLPPVSNAAQLDEQWAAMLLARGAGKLATFVDTEALRARGFAWDDDEAADEQ